MNDEVTLHNIIEPMPWSPVSQTPFSNVDSFDVAYLNDNKSILTELSYYMFGYYELHEKVRQMIGYWNSIDEECQPVWDKMDEDTQVRSFLNKYMKAEHS